LPIYSTVTKLATRITITVVLRIIISTNFKDSMERWREVDLILQKVIQAVFSLLESNFLVDSHQSEIKQKFINNNLRVKLKVLAVILSRKCSNIQVNHC
jgi:hypothetical protein